MRKPVFIMLTCLALFTGLGCREKKMPMWGRVNFKVFVHEPNANMAKPDMHVFVFHNGNKIATAVTDSLGEASFTLPDGHYTAIAQDGPIIPYLFSNDKSKSYSDTNRANGPAEFDITEGNELDMVVVLDNVAGELTAPGIFEATVMMKGIPVPNATVTLYKTLDDALNMHTDMSTPKLVTESNGSIIYPLNPGKYYMVAAWRDKSGKFYTSDTTRTKNPPPNTDANGPLPVEVKDRLYKTSYTAIMDEGE
jgi:hypothetical protein